MDLSYSKDEEAFRLEVRNFIRESLPPDIREKQKLGRRLGKDDIVTWQKILNKKGWAVPNWPVDSACRCGRSH